MPLRGTEIDVRNVDVVSMRDQCRCGQEFYNELHLRHECRECNLKWLYPPDGIKPKPGLLRRFFAWLQKESV